MDDLISLADLLTRQKIHQIEIVDDINNSKNKLSILYNNIVQGKIKSDEDALKVLYGNEANIGSLRKLKNRLYHRMINSIFFIDQSGTNYKDLFEAAITCHKNYAAIKILIGNLKRKTAIDIAQKTYRKSKKFEFTDLNYLLSSLLYIHYLFYEHNNEKQKKFLKDKEYYYYALEAENFIEALYGVLGQKLSKSSSGLEENDLNFYSNQIHKVIAYKEKVTTTKYHLYSCLFLASYYLEIKMYEKILEITENGIKFYKERKIKSSNAEYNLRNRAAIAYFLLKNYELGENLFYENLSITAESSFNWFATYNHLFAIKLVTQDFNGAHNILQNVFKSKHFEKTHPLLIQLFKIKEAYIHFLVTLGKIDPTQSSEAPLRKFRLNRFLNDVPNYSKDKRGANISILIIQMLLLVQNKKYNQVLDRLDSLNMYSHRYLRSDNTFRSNCFIKMLAKLPDADYNPIRWARYVKKFRDRLDDHPFELSYHNLDLEVIPFETLYDLVIEMLEKR